jgi:uncharacterized protein YggE
LQIDADSNPSPPRPMMRATAEAMVMSDSAQAPATYNAGDIRIDASLSAEFMLLEK